MRKMRWITGLFLAVFCLISLLVGADAVTVRAAQSDSERYVIDQADILTDGEEQSIEEKIKEMAAKWNQDFVVVTTDHAEGKDSQEYADDYYDYNGYQENGVLYLVDLDNSNVWISTSGAMIRFLTDARIESVIDAGYSQLKSQNYGDGFLAMLEETDRYMDAGIPNNQYTYNVETGEIERHYSITWMDVITALVIALICGGVFFGIINARYKMKMGNYSYPFREKGRVRYTDRQDIFVNQTVTRRHIPKNPPSGGGGQSSVHTSSSGATHGGGGRSL